MKDIFSDDNNKEDAQGIKKDIESLIKRLGNMKEYSIENLSEQIDSLYSTMENLKDKGIDIGRNNAASIYSTTRRYPLRMLIGAFVLGMITCCLIKNKS
jgi:hypothetical protein